MERQPRRRIERSQRWAAEQPKRYAAASFAVGTIDQALLGALAVRHAHLRAACLVRHLLVIDEVHSSDVYMTTLTERLLTLFRAAGGHVLLMSATVGAGTRERLVAQARMPPAFADAVAVAYPRITASHAPAVDIEPEGLAKTVRVEPCALLDDAEAVAARAVAAVGGRRPRARPAQYGQRSDRDTNGARGAAADRSPGSVPGR